MLLNAERQMTAIRLRPYQELVVESALKSLEEHRSALAVMPTGTGKSVVIGEVVRRTPGRALILAHRQELLEQLRDTIQRVSGRTVTVDQAWNYGARTGRDDVVVASVQTQISRHGTGLRMHRWRPDEFGLVVIDEAHHAVARSYRKIIEHMQHDGLKVLGVTATPDRADELALGQVFKSVAADYEILDAIVDGWLVPIRLRSVHVKGLSYASVRKTCGDLNAADLERVLTEVKVLDGMAEPISKLSAGRRTLVFCAGVKHAQRMADLLNLRAPGSAVTLLGETPTDERRRIVMDYRIGRFPILVTVGVATEGFDVPGIEVVAICRATSSRALYAQMIGRGTRPLADTVDGLDTAEERRAAIAASRKPHLEVLEFAGNAGRHRLVSAHDILGGRYEDAVVQSAKRKTKAASGPVDVAAELSEAEERARRRLLEARSAVEARVDYVAHEVDPFEWLNIVPQREKRWHVGRKLTERMQAMLQRYNVQIDRLTYSGAQQVISEIIARDLPTPKQVRLLERYGVEREGLTFTKARQMIDRLAANGWKRL